ncbi:MAG: homocysteine S-methyltransferase family protein [Actinomycetota bacterium]
MADNTLDLTDGRVHVIDGGTGTELEALGVTMVDEAWCGMANITHPEQVKAVHRLNIEAGAELIIANTFATSRHILEGAGFGDHFEAANRLGIELALTARDEAATASGRPPVPVAASISTASFGGEQPPIEVARVNFADQVKILAEAGAELFILEMMRDAELTGVILDACEPTGLPIWVGYSCFLYDGDLRMTFRYGDFELGDLLPSVADRRVELVAIMHTEVDLVDACLDIVDEHWDGPVGVYAHTGRFEPPTWVFNDTISPADYADACDRWVARGVQVIGGCCGIRPHHIEVLRDRHPRP